MLIRKEYLNRIKDFHNETSLIKIIYWLRRSDKSIILSQIIDELKNNGINEEQIIYINFESFDFSFIKYSKDLYDYIKKISSSKKKYYVFFDEIHKVEKFEKGISSLRITNQYSIFITGSNSKMTFLELSTALLVRYVSFRIFSLYFKEIVEMNKVKKKDYKNKGK